MPRLPLDGLIVLSVSYPSEDWDLHSEELAPYFKCIVLTCPSKWQKRSKSSRGGINQINKSTLFLCAPSFLFNFFLPPAFLSPSRVISQPSICHPQPVSAPSKGSDFKMERFSSASWGAQLCRLSLYLGNKKKQKKLASSHQRREIGGWKEKHKPTYAKKCGISIYCRHLCLARYSEPDQWFCNDKVIMAIPAICLPGFQRFPLCPRLSSSLP